MIDDPDCQIDALPRAPSRDEQNEAGPSCGQCECFQGLERMALCCLVDQFQRVIRPGRKTNDAVVKGPVVSNHRKPEPFVMARKGQVMHGEDAHRMEHEHDSATRPRPVNAPIQI